MAIASAIPRILAYRVDATDSRSDQTLKIAERRSGLSPSRRPAVCISNSRRTAPFRLVVTTFSNPRTDALWMVQYKSPLARWLANTGFADSVDVMQNSWILRIVSEYDKDGLAIVSAVLSSLCCCCCCCCCSRTVESRPDRACFRKVRISSFCHHRRSQSVFFTAML